VSAKETYCRVHKLKLFSRAVLTRVLYSLCSFTQTPGDAWRKITFAACARNLVTVTDPHFFSGLPAPYDMIQVSYSSPTDVRFLRDFYIPYELRGFYVPFLRISRTRTHTLYPPQENLNCSHIHSIIIVVLQCYYFSSSPSTQKTFDFSIKYASKRALAYFK